MSFFRLSGKESPKAVSFLPNPWYNWVQIKAIGRKEKTKDNEDNGILSYVSQIQEYKGKQELFTRQKPRELKHLIEIARIQSTESSNRIEGIVTTNPRLKQLMDDKTTPRNRDEEEILGYRNVLALVHEDYNAIPVRPNYILQMHRDLLRFTNLSYGGSFKTAPNEIDMVLGNGKKDTDSVFYTGFSLHSSI